MAVARTADAAAWLSAAFARPAQALAGGAAPRGGAPALLQPPDGGPASASCMRCILPASVFVSLWLAQRRSCGAPEATVPALTAAVHAWRNKKTQRAWRVTEMSGPLRTVCRRERKQPALHRRCGAAMLTMTPGASTRRVTSRTYCRAAQTPRACTSSTGRWCAAARACRIAARCPRPCRPARAGGLGMPQALHRS